MNLGALRPSPLVEQATERLREQIVGGVWPVGTRLPGETTLARELGVGRSTVREALRALAGAGLVQARQGSGVFVISDAPVADWAAKLRRAAIADVYEVRMLVEVEAARLAARRRTTEDVAGLRAALELRTALGPGAGAAFVDADVALHAAVVAAAHNPVLTDLFEEFAPVLRSGLVELVELLDLRRLEDDHGHDAHAALVEAVAGGDGEAAAQALRVELERTRAHLE